MADLTDVESAIVSIIGGAIYPNGNGQPSVLPGSAQARIGRGWPLPASLDADLAAGNAQITVFPVGGSALPTYQILNHTYTITEPVIGLTVTLVGNQITLSGTPAAGEFVTIIADDAHIYSRTGGSIAAILAALLADAQVNYPSASVSGNTLTLPVNAYLTVRQGGQATMGRVIWRQCHSIMVSVWAPSDAIRTAAAKAADVALKQNLKIAMPDTSQCVLRYQRTASNDQQEKADLYRRDLFYDAEFATIEQFPGYTITSTQVSIAKPDNSAIATTIEQPIDSLLT